MNSRLLEIIDEFAEGKLTKFAKLCGIPQGTLHGYKKGKVPSPEYLVRIREECGVSIDWFLTGIGQKYISANTEGGPCDPDPEVAQLLEGARRVLKSGNPIAFEALKHNIKYFDHAVKTEKRLTQSEEKQQELENKMESVMALVMDQQEEKDKKQKGKPVIKLGKKKGKGHTTP